MPHIFIPLRVEPPPTPEQGIDVTEEQRANAARFAFEEAEKQSTKKANKQ